MCAVVGQTVTVDCRVTSERQPMISWVKNGLPLLPRQPLDSPGELILRNVSESDSGNYTCSVSDSKHLKAKLVSMELKVPNNRKFFYNF